MLIVFDVILGSDFYYSLQESNLDSYGTCYENPENFQVLWGLWEHVKKCLYYLANKFYEGGSYVMKFLCGSAKILT